MQRRPGYYAVLAVLSIAFLWSGGSIQTETRTLAEPISAQAENDAPPPKYVLIYKVRVPKMNWVFETVGFTSVDAAIAFADDKGIDSPRFVGIWELGQALPISLSETTVQQDQVRRKWQRP